VIEQSPTRAPTCDTRKTASAVARGGAGDDARPSAFLSSCAGPRSRSRGRGERAAAGAHLSGCSARTIRGRASSLSPGTRARTEGGARRLRNSMVVRDDAHGLESGGAFDRCSCRLIAHHRWAYPYDTSWMARRFFSRDETFATRAAARGLPGHRSSSSQARACHGLEQSSSRTGGTSTPPRVAVGGAGWGGGSRIRDRVIR